MLRLHKITSNIIVSQQRQNGSSFYSTKVLKKKGQFGQIKLDKKNLQSVDPIQEKKFEDVPEPSAVDKLANIKTYNQNKTLLNQQNYYYSPSFAKLGALINSIEDLPENWAEIDHSIVLGKEKKKSGLENRDLDIPTLTNIKISKNSSGLSTPFPRLNGASPSFVAVPPLIGNSHLRGMINNRKQLNVLDLSSLYLIEKFIKVQIANDAMRSFSIHTTTPGIIHCTGMDFKTLYENRTNGKSEESLDYLKRLTKLFYLVSSVPKPLISIQDGISVGAGCAFSSNVGFRVATENSIFSVPDCSIGFFPNAGNLRFLARLPNGVGSYLALTGRRLRGPELIQTGIGNFYVHTNSVKYMDESISMPFNHIEKLLVRMQTFTSNWELETEENPTHIDKFGDAIQRCFENKTTIEQVLEALDQEPIEHPENSDWARRCTENIKRSSPISIKLTMRLLNLAQEEEISNAEYFERDYNITMALFNDPSSDLWEGIRSSIVDPSEPKWKVSSLSEVTEQMIDDIIDYQPAVKEQQLKLRKVKPSNIYFEDLVDQYIEQNQLNLKQEDKEIFRNFTPSNDPFPDRFYHNISVHYNKAQSTTYDEAENLNSVMTTYLREGRDV